MRPDEKFTEFMRAFIDGCEIEPPFYLVVIGINGSVHVTHIADTGITDHVCERIVEPGIALPATMYILALDGSGASARLVQSDHGPRLMPAPH